MKEILVCFNLLKPTGYGMHLNLNILTIVRSAHTVFMCFVFVRTNSDFCHLKIRLVFITEMKSVYSAVGSGSLNEAVCGPSFKD
jgi:hypothetical protein